MSEKQLLEINVSQLLSSGAHLGHRTSRWNPKMAPYIYSAKDGIHIIDLRKTVPLFNRALKQLYNVSKKNGKILFVGTKIHIGDVVGEYASKAGQYFVNHRWLGGMLTNWKTVSESIKELDRLDKLLEDSASVEAYTKKELLRTTRKRDSIFRSLGGIRSMNGKPDIMVVLDANKEKIAILEALKLNIPIISILDSNSTPEGIDYPIPANDDSIRAVKMYMSFFCEAILMGMEENLEKSGVNLESGYEEKPGENKNSIKVAKGEESDKEFENLIE